MGAELLLDVMHVYKIGPDGFLRQTSPHIAFCESIFPTASQDVKLGVDHVKAIISNGE